MDENAGVATCKDSHREKTIVSDLKSPIYIYIALDKAFRNLFLNFYNNNGGKDMKRQKQSLRISKYKKVHFIILFCFKNLIKLVICSIFI